MTTDTHSSDEILDSVKYLIAGSLAAAVSRCAVAPLDRVKILFQTTKGKLKFGVGRTLVEIYRREGFVGLFKGNGTHVLRMVPFSAIQYATYEHYKRLLAQLPLNSTTQADLVAGTLASATAIAATYPLDLVRTRLCVQQTVENSKYSGIFHCLRTVVKEEGGVIGSALYRGLGPALLAIGPYIVLKFHVYATLYWWTQSQSSALSHGDDVLFAHKLAGSVLAGETARACVYPLDVAKRRLQLRTQPGSSLAQRNTAQVLLAIVKEEGPRALYKGLSLNILKIVPSICVSYVTYEQCKRALLSI